MASYAYTFTSGDTVTPTKLNNARTVSNIVNADISATAAIALSKLATGALPSAITVASANIVDGTIVNADINASAAIAHSKLANITAGQVLLGNDSNVPTATALSGDVTVSNTGVTAIGSGVIVNADISGSAAIAGTKVSPNFGSQNIVTTGTVSAAAGSVVSGSSTTAALRVTQTGSGNALEVEDSTNPDATPVVIDSGGNLILGHTSTFTTRLSASNVTPSLQQLGTAAGLSSNLNARFSNDSAAGAAYFAKSRSANRGEHTIVNEGDQLGNITFGGSDGTKIVEAARITAAVDGTPGTDDMPGRITFSTTSDGGATVTERMRITSDGNVGIANTSPSEKLDVTGNIKVSGTSNFGGQVRVPFGTTATPGLSFDGDGDTGIIRPHSDEISFVTGGSQAMRINASNSVGIGVFSIDASCLLQLASTTKGFRPPVMSTTQRNAISSPAAGLMVYNSTTDKLNVYNGTTWEAVTSA